MDFKEHSLSAKELAKIVEAEVDGQYTELKDITERLMKRILHIREPEN